MTITEQAASPAELRIGDFISVPAWRTFGQVIAVESAWHGADDARRVQIQTHPEQRLSASQWYHLEPGQFTVE